jgi:predicted AAA+ superfamily ATPase
MTRREQAGEGRAGLWPELLAAEDTEWRELLADRGGSKEDWRRMARRGGFPTPALHLRTDRERAIWFDGYIRTYLERDLQDLSSITALPDFRRLMRAACHRLGQMLNQTELGRDVGLPQPTVHRYLNLLETSFLLVRISAVATNRTKRLIKTPKLYFCDPGLAAWFVGVRTPDHLSVHPQRGALFENWIMTEILKAQTNHGLKPTLHFLRDKEGHEIDALIETGPDTFHAVEIKSGETIASDFFSGLDYWRAKLTRQTITPWLIHGGTALQLREKATVLPWNDLSPLIEKIA